jgi:uncharacterized protein with PIN domain
MNCPYCKTELPNKPKKEWKYSFYQVKLFTCPKCKKTTKAYYQNGALNHTIPKAKNLKILLGKKAPQQT